MDNNLDDVRILGASEASEISTSSATYVDALNAGTLNVMTASNILVFYSAAASLTDPSDVIRIRSMIGGVPANAEDIRFVDYSVVNVTQSAVFYLPGVTADSSIKIQFRSSTGNTVKLRNQTVVAVAFPTNISMVNHKLTDLMTGETTYGEANVWQAGMLNVSNTTGALFFYSAEGDISAVNEALHVRVNASNNTANIDDIRLLDYSTINISRGAVFYIPDLSTGSYPVNVSYRSSSGNGVTLRNQTLIGAAFPGLVAKNATGISTSENSYVPALDAGILHLDKASNVTIYYSAEGTLSNPADVLRIRSKIGNISAYLPDMEFVDYSTSNVTMSAVFFSRVDAGSYPVGIEYRSSTGNRVALRNQTMIVIKADSAQQFDISGYKINDTDGDGVWSAGEVGIEGWNITLFYENGTQRASTFTNASGYYEFRNIHEGSYNVTEETRPGWNSTNGTTRTINLIQNLTDLNFTNHELIPPVLTSAGANPEEILLKDTKNADFGNMNSTLNITVTDNSGIAGVTVNLSYTGGSHVQNMTRIGENLYSTVINATMGLGNVSLPANATDMSGNSNTSANISLKVSRNGDVNGDTITDIADAMWLAKNRVGIPGYPIHPLATEVNGDGIIDIADAMYLAKHLVSLPGFDKLY